MSRHSDEVHRVADGILSVWFALAPPTAELTTPQGLALRTIVYQGPLRVGELAGELGVTVATASRTVDALEVRGLVERAEDPSDARCVRVISTAAGEKHQAGVRERFRDRVKELLDTVPEPERARLAESVETLSSLLGRPVSSPARTG